MSSTFAFVTIGQTPRTDLVPEILRHLPGEVEVDEMGVLDRMRREDLPNLAPGPGEPSLVTRLADGSQVILSRSRVQEELQELLDKLDGEAYRAVVLLCTGAFPGLTGPGLFVDAQHLVDQGTAALSAHARRIGVLVPLAGQVDTFHLRAESEQKLLFSHASPYQDQRFAEAAEELAGADLVVMHCMGYTEAQRATVARISRRPVLLARRLVATALLNLL